MADEPMPMGLDEFETEYPDLYAAVFNAGVAAERERINAIVGNWFHEDRDGSSCASAFAMDRI
jgi:hypothetical protein